LAQEPRTPEQPAVWQVICDRSATRDNPRQILIRFT
jgi:hypothetical protein